MNVKMTLSGIIRRFFKKMNALYVLTIVDAESMTESISFHLTKKSVYIFLASLFMSIFILFSVLIFFTPLKYYVPGNQGNASRKELLKLRNLSDSLITVNKLREGYVFNLLKVVNGSFGGSRDTLALSDNEIKNAQRSNDSKIDRASRYDYLKNQKLDSTDVDKKDSLVNIKNQ